MQIKVWRKNIWSPFHPKPPSNLEHSSVKWLWVPPEDFQIMYSIDIPLCVAIVLISIYIMLISLVSLSLCINPVVVVSSCILLSVYSIRIIIVSLVLIIFYLFCSYFLFLWWWFSVLNRNALDFCFVNFLISFILIQEDGEFTRNQIYSSYYKPDLALSTANCTVNLRTAWSKLLKILVRSMYESWWRNNRHFPATRLFLDCFSKCIKP